MVQYFPSITGSLTVNGNLIISGSISTSGSITISGSVASASYAATLEGLGSASFAPAATFNVVSSSYASASGSLSTRVTNLEATTSVVSSSFATTSGSLSSRVSIVEGQDATTGSNTFTGVQYVSEASNAISFTSTASLYTDGGLRVAKDSFISGTAYFNNIIVYGTSSIQYITSSQVDVGTNIITVNTDTPAVRFGGLSVFDSGSTQLTGSLFWDSEKNHWVYSNPSGSSYSGGMLMSGPRSSALGDEQGTLNNFVMKGQGGDHITSSQIIDDGTTVRIPGNLQVTGSLSGSSAVFSTEVFARNGDIQMGLDTTYSLPYMALGWGGRANANNKIYAARDTTDGIIINSATGRGVVINTNGGATNALTIASTGNATFTNTETTLNFNPQTSLLAGYNYLNFGGGSIMYRNASDLYIGSNAKYGSAGTLIAKYTTAQGMGMLTMNGGALNYQANDTSVTAGTSYAVPIRFTITGAGNVGIGTSSPNDLLEIKSTTANQANVRLYNTFNDGSNVYGISWFRNYDSATNSQACFINYVREGGSGGYMSFGTGTVGSIAEKMRITSGGAVLINSNTVVGSDSRLNVDGPNAGPTFSNSTTGQQTLLCWNKANTGDNLWIEFHVGSTLATRGSIDYNRSTNNTRYNTSSDANLKNIIGDSNKQKSIDILNSTKIKEFSWKEDESNKTQIGVIAQELYETYKGAVSVGSDESLLGTEDYKSWKVDKTAFTFHLIAGWQKHEQIIKDLQAQIDELTQKVNALENK
jgi:hypothetical protein